MLYSFQWQTFPERWTRSDLREDDEEIDLAVKQLHACWIHKNVIIRNILTYMNMYV